MKRKQILSTAIIISMICFGCEKNKEVSSADLSVNAMGLYSGTFVVVGAGQVWETCQVYRVSNTSLNLKKNTASGQTSPISHEINLNDGGSSKIIPTYSDSEGTINGSM
jgi:hypothetical protein